MGLVKTVGGVIDGAGSCDLFTDGACLLPHEPPLRLAAWAVTIGRLDWNTLDHHVLAAGPLPGLHQTAFRAELYAAAVALEWASTQACEMRIWSDCQPMEQLWMGSAASKLGCITFRRTGRMLICGFE